MLVLVLVLVLLLLLLNGNNQCRQLLFGCQPRINVARGRDSSRSRSRSRSRGRGGWWKRRPMGVAGIELLARGRWHRSTVVSRRRGMESRLLLADGLSDSVNQARCRFKVHLRHVKAGAQRCQHAWVSRRRRTWVRLGHAVTSFAGHCRSRRRHVLKLALRLSTVRVHVHLLLMRMLMVRRLLM